MSIVFVGLLLAITICAIVSVCYKCKCIPSRTKRRSTARQMDALNMYLLNDHMEKTRTKEEDVLDFHCRLLSIPFDQIKDIQTIGTGGSGTVVLKGTWNFTPVAIKMFSYRDDYREEFINELNLLSYVHIYK